MSYNLRTPYGVLSGERVKCTISMQIWCRIMLTQVYFAGDNYNNLHGLLRLLLICIIFEFYAYFKVNSLYNGKNYSKKCRGLKNTGCYLQQRRTICGSHNWSVGPSMATKIAVDGPTPCTVRDPTVAQHSILVCQS